MNGDLGPLDDFDTPDEDDDEASKLREVAAKPRRYQRAELPIMPHGMRPFALGHDYVSTACQHRVHDQCRQRCKFCDVGCLCVCHRWAIPVESM